MIYVVLSFLIVAILFMNIKKVVQVGVSDLSFEIIGLICILIFNLLDMTNGTNDLFFNLILTTITLLVIELLYADKHISILKLINGNTKRKRISKSEKRILISLILVYAFSLGTLICNAGMESGFFYVFITLFILFIITKLITYFFIPTK